MGVRPSAMEMSPRGRVPCTYKPVAWRPRAGSLQWAGRGGDAHGRFLQQVDGVVATALALQEDTWGGAATRVERAPAAAMQQAGIPFGESRKRRSAWWVGRNAASCY